VTRGAAINSNPRNAIASRAPAKGFIVARAPVRRRGIIPDRLRLGATPLTAERTRFRVWAPRAQAVALMVTKPRASSACRVALDRAADGYFEGEAQAPAGSRYQFALDDTHWYPDPASRFQPEGPSGPSEVIDPSTFVWTDEEWRGLDARGLVVYEMHVGTFTREGTWRAAADHLPWLAELGVNAIEMLPVADFPGRFGWGYDGVSFFAPTRLYGRPDDLRAFIDRAHACGIGVVLDVVYNHAGSADCCLGAYSNHYFARQSSDWGPAFNFDGPDAAHVRTFVLENAAYWIREFHFDGLRLDATQQIFDRSPVHIMREIAATTRRAAPRRRVWIVGENEPQHARLFRPTSTGGYGLDALWNDDYHHSAMVAATGQREAYYTDYLGAPQEFVSAAKYGFLYQGQHYAWQKNGRGTSASGIEPQAFVCFLQNHDQVANTLNGARLHQRTSPGRYRALTALTLLGPWTPMLLQGQEFSASSPFLYFADHEPEIAALVEKGRREFLAQFVSLRSATEHSVPDLPHDPNTFTRCQLDHDERHRHHHAVALHRSLIRLRRTDPTIALQGSRGLDGAVLGPQAFVLRLFGAADTTTNGGHCTGGDRLLVVNLGPYLDLPAIPEPLLAPPAGERPWRAIWSSDDPEYGGLGVSPVVGDHPWRLPAESAYLFA